VAGAVLRVEPELLAEVVLRRPARRAAAAAVTVAAAAAADRVDLGEGRLERLVHHARYEQVLPIPVGLGPGRRRAMMEHVLEAERVQLKLERQALDHVPAQPVDVQPAHLGERGPALVQERGQLVVGQDAELGALGVVVDRLDHDLGLQAGCRRKGVSTGTARGTRGRVARGLP